MKLRTNDQVLFWDGNTLMELTTVVLVDKEKSQVKLSNGVLLERTALKKGYFKRADKTNRNPSRAWKYEGEEIKSIWEAYLFKRRVSLKLKDLEKKLNQITITDLVENKDQVNYLLTVQENLNKIC